MLDPTLCAHMRILDNLQTATQQALMATAGSAQFSLAFSLACRRWLLDQLGQLALQQLLERGRLPAVRRGEGLLVEARRGRLAHVGGAHLEHVAAAKRARALRRGSDTRVARVKHFFFSKFKPARMSDVAQRSSQID